MFYLQENVLWWLVKIGNIRILLRQWERTLAAQRGVCLISYGVDILHESSLITISNKFQISAVRIDKPIHVHSCSIYHYVFAILRFTTLQFL